MFQEENEREDKLKLVYREKNNTKVRSCKKKEKRNS